MNEIQRLIHEMCPDGVPMVALISVADVLYGCPFDAKQFTDNDSYIPLIRIRDVVPGIPSTYYSGDYQDIYIIHKGDILVGMDGNFNLEKWKSDRNGVLCQRVCKIESNSKGLVLNNYLYHYLGPLFKLIEESTPGGSVKHLSAKTINQIQIPLPPLTIQQRIVDILDKFTSLVSSLDSEIALRQKQYEYYRNKLLSFEEGEEGVEWTNLEKIAEIGTGSSNTNEGIKDGAFPFYTRGQEVLSKNEYEFDETAIITAGDGVGVGKVFHYVSGKYALHQRAYRIHIINDNVIPRYYYYYMVLTFYSYISQNSVFSSVNSVRKPKLLAYPVPVIPLDKQLSIVRTLDTFESLLTNLKKERELRQKQYEYYREKLLTFA